MSVTRQSVQGDAISEADDLMLREAWLQANGKTLAADVVAQSRSRLEMRRRLRPAVATTDAALPIHEHRDQIIAALREHQVVVVSGETGSGKTTQLPQMALAAGFGRRAMIGHTQPRRLAARSVAARIADETAMPLGEGVGFAIRFDDRSSPNTLVRLMTDGILLNELGRDRLLLNYDLIIIDEAHERSLNIDFLIGFLATLLPRRPDLRVIITSATIDHQRFAAHFGDAPVIEVSGRGYPVTVQYATRPAASDDSREVARRVCDAIADIERQTLPKGARDVLVFLPGEREIRDAERALTKSGIASANRWRILPLFGRLSDKQQNEVFKSQPGRRIVLATNVAETSLTVPRIGAVIDSGLARVSRYSHRSRIQRLQLEPVSQASANQRAGRCGRIGPGVCIRLYDAADFEARATFTDAEIMRTNLASVVLQMAALGLGDVADFPFLDQPEPAQVEDAYRLLFELGAIDEQQVITRQGRELARLPLDPRLGRMLLGAMQAPLEAARVVVVAGLSIQDPRQRPVDHAALADEAHATFRDEQSDFVTLLRLWQQAAAQRATSSLRQYENWCEGQFLSPRRMREWREVALQLARQCKVDVAALSPQLVLDEAQRRALHEAVLSGLLSHVGHRDENNTFLGAGQRRFQIHVSSALHAKPPQWLMALEIVQTHKRLARYCAAVDNDMILRAAGLLLDYRYERPRWQPRRGRVEAARTTLLFGLVIEANRRVNFGPIDRQSARDVFIRQGLVRDRVRLQASFIEHNRAQLERIAAAAGRLRRAIEISDSELAALYDARLPQSVFDARSLKRWLARKPAAAKSLHFTDAELQSEKANVDEASVPLLARAAGNALNIAYQFTPQQPGDGANIQVPEALLGAVRAAEIDHSVPEFLRRRVELRLRALPKPMRKQLQPLAETARTMVAQLQGDHTGKLNERLRRLLLREYSLQPDHEVWQALAEPEYLQPNIVVVGKRGARLREGRDLSSLQAEAPPPKRAAKADTGVSPSPLSRGWSFGVVPEQRNANIDGLDIVRYPAFMVRTDGVVVHEFLNLAEARESHQHGVLALLRSRFSQQLKMARKQLLAQRSIQLRWAVFDDKGAAALLADFATSMLLHTFGDDLHTIRDEPAWHQRCEQRRASLMESAAEILSGLDATLQALAACRDAAAGVPAPFAEARDDVVAVMADLVYPGFIAATPADRLGELPRYLKACTLRLQRIASNPERDTASLAMIVSLQARVEALGATIVGPQQRAAVAQFGWLVHELRVSLFAQSLGTREKVSVRRLEKRWDEILRMQD